MSCFWFSTCLLLCKLLLCLWLPSSGEERRSRERRGGGWRQRMKNRRTRRLTTFLGRVFSLIFLLHAQLSSSCVVRREAFSRLMLRSGIRGSSLLFQPLYFCKSIRKVVKRMLLLLHFLSFMSCSCMCFFLGGKEDAGEINTKYNDRQALFCFESFFLLIFRQ